MCRIILRVIAPADMTEDEIIEVQKSMKESI